MNIPRIPRLRLPRPRIIWRPSPDLVSDAGLVAGLASVAAGCGWIFPPAAPIIGGLFLAAVAWIAGRPEPETTPAQRGVVERFYSVDEDQDVE